STQRYGRQSIGPYALIACLAGLFHLGEPDDSRAVDDERAAVGDARVGVEHPVGLSHRAVWPEVGKHREQKAALGRPYLVCRRRYHRDGQRDRVVVLVSGQIVADLVQLALADTGERERKE